MPVFPGSVPGSAVAQCDGRLTLTTAVPVTTSDVTAAGTIYFTPYKGNQVSVYDGSVWTQRTFGELSLALTATNGSVYDVFLYDNAGTLTLETLVWTDATTRATALVMQDGVLCKTGALTRRYLGTFYATGTNQTSDSGGGSGVAGFRCVWNYYNRVPRHVLAYESTASWSYGTDTWRASNASAINRLSMVIGVSEDAVEVKATTATLDGAVYSMGLCAIGLDSTSTPATGTVSKGFGYGPTWSIMSAYNGYPGIGLHYLQQLERPLTGYGYTTVTFDGAGDSAIKGTVMA